MRKILSLLLVMLLATAAHAGDWIRVKGGEFDVKLDSLAVEHRLWVYIKNESKIVFMPREQYIYQYQAINAEEIYINALCDNPGEKNLDKEFIVVLDGGSCFFQVIYNLKSAGFSRLLVNGEA